MALFQSPDPEAQRERHAENNHERSLHQQLQDANVKRKNGDGMNTRYLEKITDTSLDDGTYRMIDAMLSQDFVLGNYNDAEMHEFRWELPLLGLKVEVAHPPKESFVQGDDRQYYADDESDGLKSLSDIQKNDIYQILRLGVKARGTRSHGGFQQEELGKTVSVSEVRDDNQGQQNGFFSGWG